MAQTTRTRIVILGGGFGGVYTAMALEKRFRGAAPVDLTLVSKENYLVFQPMLPEVIAGSIGLLDVITPIRRLCLRTTLYTRTIESIDLDNHRVTAPAGFGSQHYALEYDHLVLALGNVTSFAGQPGLREHALPLKNLGDALALDEAVAPHAHDCAHRAGGKPFGFLPPHGRKSRRGLAPAQARFHGRVLLLRGLEHRGICTHLRADSGGAYGPALVLLRVGQHLALANEAIAWLVRGEVRLGGPSPPCPARGAGGGHAPSADGLLPPGAWAAPAAALRLALRRCQGRGGGGPAGTPLRLDPRGVLGQRRGGRAVRTRIRRGVRRCELTRMDHNPTAPCSGTPSGAGCNLPRRLPLCPCQRPRDAAPGESAVAATRRPMTRCPGHWTRV